MKSLKDVKAQLLANPAVRQAYDAQAPEFELARELIAARMKAGLTQGDVAARMGTTQSVVARIESGRGTPSMRTVQRFASAVGARAVVRMEPLTAARPAAATQAQHRHRRLVSRPRARHHGHHLDTV